MAARRREPVQPRPGLVPALRPQASPVDVFVRPNPNSGNTTIFDFAPISSTIQGVLADKARQRGAERALEGERFVAERPELTEHLERSAKEAGKDPKERAKALKREFAWLQEQGIIRSAADPYFQIGYARAAARLMAGKYRDRVLGRLDEATAITNAQGEPAAPADLERILAEEWEQVGDNPAVQSFYGGTEALGIKQRVDEEMRSRAASGRADRIEQEYRRTLLQDVGQRFDEILLANGQVTTETLRPITDFVTEEIHGHNVPNPRELVLEALKLSFQRAAGADPEEAVRAVYAAQDLEVGGVRLGDDRSGVGQELENLKRRYREEAEEHAHREVNQESAKRAKAVQAGESKYVPLLIQAHRDGQNLSRIVDQLSDEFVAADPVYGSFVVDEMQKYARSLDQRRESDAQVMDRMNVLLADGDLGAAEDLLRASLSVGDVTGQDYAQGLTMIQQRRDASPYVEQSGLYQSYKGRYAALIPQDLTPLVQDRFERQAVDAQRRMEADFVAYVRTTAGQPNREELHRVWLDGRLATDEAELRKSTEGLAEGRDALQAEIRGRFDRHQDASDLIAQGEAAGRLTRTEAAALRTKNIDSASRDRFFALPEYGETVADLRDLIVTELQDTPEAARLSRALERELRDRYDGALDGILNDAAVDPRQFEARARAALRGVWAEIQDERFPGKRSPIQAGVEAKKPVAQVAAEVQAQEDDRARSGVWAQDLSTPEGREAFSANSPHLERDPNVSERFYEYAAGWMSGRDPFFGQPVDRDTMAHRAMDEAARLAVSGLPDEQKRAAIGAVVSTVGLDWRGVLADRAVFEVSDAEKNAIADQLFHERLNLKYGTGGRPKADTARIIRELEARLAPIEFDMTGHVYRPYSTPFFQSRAALEALSQDPAWPDFLRRLGIDASDEGAVDLFVTEQLKTIARTNPR